LGGGERFARIRRSWVGPIGVVELANSGFALCAGFALWVVWERGSIGYQSFSHNGDVFELTHLQNFRVSSVALKSLQKFCQGPHLAAPLPGGRVVSPPPPPPPQGPGHAISREFAFGPLDCCRRAVSSLPAPTPPPPRRPAGAPVPHRVSYAELYGDSNFSIRSNGPQFLWPSFSSRLHYPPPPSLWRRSPRPRPQVP